MENLREETDDLRDPESLALDKAEEKLGTGDVAYRSKVGPVTGARLVALVGLEDGPN